VKLAFNIIICNPCNHKERKYLKLAEELKKMDENKISYFSFNGMEFHAKPCNIYDGDTFSVIFKYRDEYIKYRCRCYGYDSPEMKPLLSKSNRSEEIALAKLAKERFTELLNKGPNGLVKIKCYGFDKYGRILVTVYNNIDQESINDIMLKENHGKPYDGGRKNPY
jgi:endonuclease YncB( thermonuclease family)